MNTPSFLKKDRVITFISLLILLTLVAPLNAFAYPLDNQPLVRPDFAKAGMPTGISNSPGFYAASTLAPNVKSQVVGGANTQDGVHFSLEQQNQLSANPVLTDSLFKTKWQRADKPIADGG